MRNKIFLVLFSIFSCVATLFILEVAVRLFFPEINRQDTQLSLFQENSFGDSIGWKPNATGSSFDGEVIIDELGFRKMKGPENANSAWLILGDSVAFGVGVKTEETFSDLLQKEYPNKKIWNTSVVGYSVDNYKDVVDHFIESNPGPKLEKVLLFFTLNDVYKGLNIQPTVSGLNAVLFFLKRNSKFSMLMIKLLFDRSKTYFQYDSNMYTPENKLFIAAMEKIRVISEKLRERNIDFTVVLLPYEYQLRVHDEKVTAPQKLLIENLDKMKIQSVDTYPPIANLHRESKDFYLFIDAMHFSATGHKEIFNILKEKFKK